MVKSYLFSLMEVSVLFFNDGVKYPYSLPWLQILFRKTHHPETEVEQEFLDDSFNRTYIDENESDE